MSGIRGAIFLLGYGAPTNKEETEVFIKNIVGERLSDDIMKKVLEKYAYFNYRSPYMDEVYDFYDGLKKEIRDFDIYVGMKYIQPYTKDVIQKIYEKEYDVVHCIPLMPFYSAYLMNKYFEDILAYLERKPNNMRLFFYKSWYKSFGFIKSFKVAIERKLREENLSYRDVFFVFSAHNVPVNAMDRYGYDLELFVRKLGDIEEYVICYQSKPPYAKGRWYSPSLEEVIGNYDGKKPILIVPVVFLFNNMEILWDIDIEIIKRYDSRKKVFRSYLPDKKYLIEAIKEVVGGLRSKGFKGL